MDRIREQMVSHSSLGSGVSISASDDAARLGIKLLCLAGAFAAGREAISLLFLGSTKLKLELVPLPTRPEIPRMQPRTGGVGIPYEQCAAQLFQYYTSIGPR